MTLEQYFYDVEQRTRRAGGFVMWFNPPRPTRSPQRSTEADVSSTAPVLRGGAKPVDGAPLATTP